MAQVVINPPRTPIGKVGGVPIEITPEWYRFFVAIQKLLGGDSGGSNPFDDNTFLAANPGAAAAIQQSQDDFSPPVIAVAMADDLTPPVIPVASDDLLYPYVSPASL